MFSPGAPVTTAGDNCDGLFVWLKGAEVGPPNLLQVEEQEAGKLSAENERIESAKTVL